MASKTSHLSPRNSEVNALEQKGYFLSKKIGQGSYATVHLSDFLDPSSQRRMRLACKIFDKSKAPRDFLDKFFPRELHILMQIENPHIIQVHSILQRGQRVFIFMRYAERGDLLEFVKQNGAVSEGQARIWFRQMVAGLQYLHGRNIAHRDLKCENILLSRRWNAKLADFGFARSCVDNTGRRVLSQTYCGSAAYAAPEVVSGTPYNPKLADVWSLGVILFIMLNASMPFDDSNLRKLLRDQTSRNWAFRSRIRDTVTREVKNMVAGLLEPDLTRRLTLDRVAGTEWIQTRRSSRPTTTETAESSRSTETQPESSTPTLTLTSPPPFETTVSSTTPPVPETPLAREISPPKSNSVSIEHSQDTREHRREDSEPKDSFEDPPSKKSRPPSANKELYQTAS